MTNALPPAHWAADPSGRHEYRYWDGARWTDHVADQGRPDLDPIINEPAAATSEPTATPEPTATADAPQETPSIAWRPDAHTAASPARADAPGPPEPDAEPATWPPEPDAEPGELPPTEAGWGAPTPAVPVAPAAVTPAAITPAAITPTPSSVAPPPPPPVEGTGFVTAGRMSVYGTTAWRAMSGLKTALVVLFVALALSSLGLLVTAGNRIAAVDDFQQTRSIANARALKDADDAISAAANIYSILRIAIFVVFLIWMWRASKNALDVMGRDRPKFTPGWSIGGWFIPLANFVIPVLIVQGLWRASAPGTAPGTTWRAAKGSALVGFWWAAFLVSILSAFTMGDDANLNDVKNADGVVAFGAIASVVAAVLAILVVVQLTRRFEERRVEELGA